MITMRILFTLFSSIVFGHILRAQPERLFASYFGGSLNETVNDVEVDEAGNIYVCGTTESPDFTATIGAHQDTYSGETDCYFMKINSLHELEWATFYGGDDIEGCTDIDFYNGRLYFSGSTSSSNLISTSGAFNESLGGMQDAFVGAFNPDGTLEWASYYGAASYDKSIGIAIKNDFIYVTGQTGSDTGFATSDAQDDSLNGESDAFLMKLSINGDVIYCSFIGGEGDETGRDIQIDEANNIYLVGGSLSLSGISTIGSFQEENSGSVDAFVACFNAEMILNWATYYGGESGETPWGLTLTANNSIVIFGQTQSATSIVYEPTFQNERNGFVDFFLAQFTLDGAFEWSTYLGGLDTEYPGRVAMNGEWIVVSGYTNSDDYPVTMNANQSTSNGSSDICISAFDANHQLIYSSYYGGQGSEGSGEFAFNDNKMILCGATSSTSGMVTSDAFQMDHVGFLYDFCIAIFSEIVAVEEFATHSISIFPNPSSQFVQVTSTQKINQIELYDMLGQMLASYFPKDVSQFAINTSGLESGSYVVRTYVEGRVSASMVVVVKE